MEIKEAIQSIADAETITGFTAQSVVKDDKLLGSFCTMIHDQYYRDGNKDSLIEMYGEEVIETILAYGEDNNLIKKEGGNDVSN